MRLSGAAILLAVFVLIPIMKWWRRGFDMYEIEADESEPLQPVLDSPSGRALLSDMSMLIEDLRGVQAQQARGKLERRVDDDDNGDSWEEDRIRDDLAAGIMTRIKQLSPSEIEQVRAGGFDPHKSLGLLRTLWTDDAEALGEQMVGLVAQRDAMVVPPVDDDLADA